MIKAKTLRGRMTLFVMLIMISSSILTGIIVYLLNVLKLIPSSLTATLWMPVIILTVSSILGTVIATVLSKSVLKPITDIAEATKSVAKGDFSITVDEGNTAGEIKMLVKNFNLMVKELGSIEMFRSDFISNFSHEFKTPIASIHGFAKQLEKGNLSEEKKQQYISIIAKESKNVLGLATNVLLLSKLESQAILTDCVEFSIDEQIRSVVILLEKEWTKKNIEIELELTDIEYYGNPDIIARIWINLLSNAIKFSRENGEINVSTKLKDGYVVVAVQDHGIGMSKEVAEHIFDKFYQGDKSHSTEGNGLGLPLVKRIVELCNGSITVETEENRGTVFTIFFK